MKYRLSIGWLIPLGFLMCLLLVSAPSHARNRRGFRYVAGTWDVKGSCKENIQLGRDSMSFRCKKKVFEISFSDIAFMEYRHAPSRKVRSAGVEWRRGLPGRNHVRVVPFKKRKNRFFTVVYRKNGKLESAVFRVKPPVMRPYLAELDLRSGQRVEMESFER